MADISLTPDQRYDVDRARELAAAHDESDEAPRARVERARASGEIAARRHTEARPRLAAIPWQSPPA